MSALHGKSDEDKEETARQKRNNPRSFRLAGLSDEDKEENLRRQREAQSLNRSKWEKILKDTQENPICWEDLLLELKKKKVLWYPQAGGDFNDLYYFDPSTLRDEEIDVEGPDIFIHTSSWAPSDNETALNFHPFAVLSEGPLRIVVERVRRISFGNINYNSNGVGSHSAPHGTFDEPMAFCLDLNMTADQIQYSKRCLYFFFESTNFLEECIVKCNMKISHIFMQQQNVRFPLHDCIPGFFSFMGTQCFGMDDVPALPEPNDLPDAVRSQLLRDSYAPRACRIEEMAADRQILNESIWFYRVE